MLKRINHHCNNSRRPGPSLKPLIVIVGESSFRRCHRHSVNSILKNAVPFHQAQWITIKRVRMQLGYGFLKASRHCVYKQMASA